eukprot:gene1687-2031_t
MAAATFDDLIHEHVGSWGWGQVLILLASSCSWSTLAIIVLSMVFVSQQPDWDCTNATDAQCLSVKHGSVGNMGFCALSPHQYHWVQPHISLVSSFNLTCSNNWKVGLSNGVGFAGYLVGSSLFGWLADRFGRKTCLVLSNLTSAASAVLCASSQSYWLHVVWRTLLGFCCTGLPVASYVLSTESVGSSVRGRAGSYSQMIYHVGEFLLPAMAFLLKDWRLMYVAVAVCCCLSALLVLPLPESPRWLLLHGRWQKAEAALDWLAVLNGRQLPAGLVTPELAAFEQAAGTADAIEAATKDRSPTAAYVMAAASSDAVVAMPDHEDDSAGCADNLAGSVYINFLVMSLGEVPMTLVAAVLVDRLGRRLTVVTGLLLTGLSCLACGLLPLGWLTTAMACIGKGAVSGSWTISYVYSCELFPTSIRSSALAGTNQASRIGGMVAPAVLYMGEQLHSMQLPFLSIGVAALATVATVLLLPETRGQPQPDTVEHVEQLFGSHFNKSRAAVAEGGGSFGSVRQGSKLRRLLSRLSSSSGGGEGSWTLPVVPNSNGRYAAAPSTSGWRALDTQNLGGTTPILSMQPQQAMQQELAAVQPEVTAH